MNDPTTALTDAQAAALASRALNPAGAHDLGITAVNTAADLPDDMNDEERKWWDSMLPALLIAHDEPDRPTVYQLRPDTPPKGKDGRPRKYIQQKGTGAVRSLPGVMRDRYDAGEFSEVWLVEGTMQARVAALHAPPHVLVVGMLGCWGARRQSGADTLPAWLAKAVKGKTTRVVLDADLTTNTNVWDAAARTREQLTGAKAAEVHTPVIAAPGQPSNAGLDDIVAAAKKKRRAALLVELVTAPAPELPPRPADGPGPLVVTPPGVEPWNPDSFETTTITLSGITGDSPDTLDLRLADIQDAAHYEQEIAAAVRAGRAVIIEVPEKATEDRATWRRARNLIELVQRAAESDAKVRLLIRPTGTPVRIEQERGDAVEKLPPEPIAFPNDVVRAFREFAPASRLAQPFHEALMSRGWAVINDNPSNRDSSLIYANFGRDNYGIWRASYGSSITEVTEYNDKGEPVIKSVKEYGTVLTRVAPFVSVRREKVIPMTGDKQESPHSPFRRELTALVAVRS